MAVLEVNKLVGAVLVALLLIMTVGQLGNLIVGERHEAARAPVAVADAPATSTAPAEPLPPIAPLLASADVEAGKTVAKKCAACHTLEKGGVTKTGPNLYDVIGAKVARNGDFKYSAAMAGLNADWNYEALNAFLFKPQAFAKGTRMSFPGLAKPAERAAVIAYLRTLSDAPKPLP